MKRVLELEGVIRELKAQVAAGTAPGHDVPQVLETKPFLSLKSVHHRERDGNV